MKTVGNNFKIVSVMVGMAMAAAVVLLIFAGLSHAFNAQPGTADEGFVVDNGYYQ